MTLWSIPDAPTADLMVVFYEELLAGRSKSLALRHAMLAMKKRYSDRQSVTLNEGPQPYHATDSWIHGR